MVRRKAAGVILMCGLLLASCNQAALTTPSTIVQKTYSPETVFQGVMFGSGEVAKLFPEIWESEQYKEATKNVTPQARQQQIEHERQILTIIKANDPEFMTRFHAGITSGDPYKVESSMVEGAAKVEAALKTMGVDVEKLKAEAQTEGGVSGLCLAGWLTVAVAVHIAAVAVHAYAMINVRTVAAAWTSWLGKATEGGTIADDTWMATVAKRLASN